MAFTEADMEARRWLADRMESAGIAARHDGAANVIGRIGDDADVPSVMIGSHLDTVPGAGHLDGALGIVVALEVLRAIREAGWTTEHPLEMVAFSDEEGRFGPPVGSRAMVGDLTRADLFEAADLDGNRLVDVMKDRGLNPNNVLSARRTPESLKAYVELHIEQGPILEQKQCQIGIVDSFAGLFKWTVRLIGDADHAGTTPMPMRQDAFMGLAEFAAAIQRVLDENGSAESVATIGRVELTPGSANTVPGRAEFSLDVRDPNQEVLEDLGNALRRVLSAIARRRSLMFEFDVLSVITPVSCADEVVRQIGAAVEHLGVKSHRMLSGAIHDAQIMSRITRVGMIFVPSKDGRSHSPAEWTHWEDIEVGAEVALQTVLGLAGGQQKA